MALYYILDFTGQSSLDIAAEQGHHSLVKLLIEKYDALKHLDDGKLFYHFKGTVHAIKSLVKEAIAF